MLTLAIRACSGLSWYCKQSYGRYILRAKKQDAETNLVSEKKQNRKRMLNVACQPKHATTDLTIRLASRDKLRQINANF